MTNNANIYTKNFLTNVLLRIDFNPIENWGDSDLRSQLKNKLKVDFPNIEELKGQDFEVFFGPDSSPELKTNTREGLRFIDSDSKKFVVCDSVSFLFEMKIYTNFTDFYSSFEKYLLMFKEIYKPTTTKRIGLRYINQIYIPKGATFDLEGYFNSNIITKNENIAKDTKPLRLMNLSEYSYNNSLLRFQYGMFNSEYPNPIAKKEFILDYDLYSTEELNIDSLKKEIKSYNDVITECFEESIGPKLRELMNEKENSKGD